MFTMRRVEFKTNPLTVDQFDACVVMVKHWVADGFTPNETFQVNQQAPSSASETGDSPSNAKEVDEANQPILVEKDKSRKRLLE
ncbi:hypothetical protein YC2023_078552 [Brassica napus]